MHLNKKLAALAGVAALAVTAVTVGAATADPSSTPRTYFAVGSDTTQDVMNGLTNGYTNCSGTAVGAAAGTIESWDAFGGTGTWTQTWPRPAGSGDGVNALSATWDKGPGGTPNDRWTPAGGTVVDFEQGVDTDGAGTADNGANDGVDEVEIARSSSGPSTAGSDLQYVPLARDAVGVAARAYTGGGPTFATVTGEELRYIFSGTITGGTSPATYTAPSGGLGGTITKGVGTTDPFVTIGGTNYNILPVLPQTSSGTRKFFISAIGGPSIGSWVDQSTNPAENEFDDAVFNTAGSIVPFSAAQAVYQLNHCVVLGGVTAVDHTDGATFPSIDGGSMVAGSTPGSYTPGTLFGNLTSLPSGFARDVYNVVATSQYTGTLKSTVDALGNASYGTPPTNKVVRDFGFAALTTSYSTSTGLKGGVFTN